MKYITYRRFKGKALCGNVNLPATTEVENIDGVITYEGKPICYDTSANAHKHFARNDDNHGLRRGRLIKAIQAKLEKQDGDYQKRWDKVWDDPECQPFKRIEFEDYWLWNHDFYNADIGVLEHIADLVGAKVVE